MTTTEGRLLAVTASEEETEALGARLAAELAPDGVLLLSGDLGAGKTVLARGLFAALGVPREEVQSPTFTLVREHSGVGGVRLVHADLYRLEPEEAYGVGLEELLGGPGVKVVEWAERLPWVVRGEGVRRLVIRRTSGGREVREVLE